MGIIEKKLKNLPSSSGVYIMLDGEKKVIYIGKAKALKNRVRQYFHSPVSFNDKTMAMVSKIADFSYILTHNEADAIALEANLIKKYKPPYNILLKDDKHFPYIKVNIKDDFPVFKITRKVLSDKCLYFGPYMGGVRATELLQIISDAYMLKPCNVNIIKISKNHRPCLNYHIKKCIAPCRGNISAKEYKKLVVSACNFLKGNDSEIKQILFDKMQKLSDSEQYEAAAAVRDRIKMIDKLKEKRIAALPQKKDMDVLAYYTDGKYGAVSVLIIRKGNIEGVKSFTVSDAGLYDEETLTSFITQYYSINKTAPKEILISNNIEISLIESYITKICKYTVKVASPKRGDKKKLADMAKDNAREYLYKYIENIKHKKELTQGAALQLAQMLRLKKIPKKMECYDISHISGTDKTASMAVFVDGEKQAALYRRFKIRLEGNNDYGSMEEVIKRRFLRYNDAQTDDESFSILPDLIIIDGGKGQLSSAAKILDELNIDVEIISLAKREEEVYTLQTQSAIILPRSSLALRLLQRIRDEAHRFALSYHRKLREKNMASSLDNITGIGKKRRKALIKAFGSVEHIKKASIAELKKLEGIDSMLARNIFNYFNKDK